MALFGWAPAETVLDDAYLDLGNVLAAVRGGSSAFGRGFVHLVLVVGLERAHPDELVLGSIYPRACDVDAELRAGRHDLLVELLDPRVQHAAIDRIDADLR